MADVRTMFIVIRKDLRRTLNWPVGSVVVQGCHATAAALWTYRDDERVKQYMSDIGAMTKVTLETKNDTSLLKVADSLKEKNVPFYLWVEQPENMPTCLATVPVARSDLGDALKKCSLMS